jgi:hypothetical protein
MKSSLCPGLIIAIAAALAGSTIGRAAAAELPPERPAVTVEAVLPGCRSLVATQGAATSTEAGFCNGIIDGLLYLGEMLPADFCYAVPVDTPRVLVAAAIVEEIEPLYSSLKEHHFRALALEVLQYRWPCHYG